MNSLNKSPQPQLQACLEMLTNQLSAMAGQFDQLNSSVSAFAKILKKDNVDAHDIENLKGALNTSKMEASISGAPTAPGSPKTKPSTPRGGRSHRLKPRRERHPGGHRSRAVPRQSPQLRPVLETE